MTTVSIHVLPNPVQDEETFREYSSRLRTVRLRSLQRDPSRWISRYESEIKEPPEFWWKRLREPGVTHHVLVSHTSVNDISSAGLLDGEWVGFAVTTGPSAREQPVYFIAAVYIDQEFRGRGLGKRLMQEVLSTVKEQASKAGQGSPSCTIGALHGNQVAVNLYQNVGFRITDPDEVVEKEGRTYHAFSMRLDL